METSEIINNWRRTYTEYLFHHGITDEKDINQCWISHSNSMMDYWHKQSRGEVQRIWKTFALMLIDNTNTYERINENYRRNARMDVKVKGTGGRYWK